MRDRFHMSFPTKWDVILFFVEVASVLEITPCTSEPCVVGICIYPVGGHTFECICGDGFTGDLCDIGENCMFSFPYILYNEIGFYFRGDAFEEPGPCGSDPCFTGSCVNGDDRFDCVCPDGYTGVTCDHRKKIAHMYLQGHPAAYQSNVCFIKL